MRTGGVTATGAAAGAAGAAVASGAGVVGWAGAAAGAGAAGAAAAGALFVEACAPADWQPAVKTTASVTAKQATHFCIRGFVFFIKFLWFCGTRFQFRQINYVVAPGRRQAKTGTGTFTLNGSAGYFASRIEIQARPEGKNRSHRRTSRAGWRLRKTRAGIPAAAQSACARLTSRHLIQPTSAAARSRARQNFNPVDLGIFHVGRERDG